MTASRPPYAARFSGLSPIFSATLAEQGGHVVQVVRGHLAEDRPGGIWVHGATVAEQALRAATGFSDEVFMMRFL
jgi:hypothetical protein